jgi:uncharacterized repeat protein (TIGR01451 family)
MQRKTSLSARSRDKRLWHGLGVSALSLAIFASQAGPALAAIDNTATPSGTPASGTLPTPPTSSVSVPVAPATPTLTVAKSVPANVTDTNADGIVGPGDTITYTYVITNTGNVTINTVSPVDAGPTFNTLPRTGAALSFTLVSTTNVASTGAQLLPAESGTWTAVYTLTAVDAYRAAGLLAASTTAVENSATATGAPVSGTLGAVAPSTAETQIPANPRFSIVKSFTFTTDTGTAGQADVGDVIRYRYEVNNTGNVTINNVAVTDVHEGVTLSGQPLGETIAVLQGGFDGPLASASPAVPSTDAVANNGVWSVLRPGARIVFFYDHTVTQTEFNNQ